MECNARQQGRRIRFALDEARVVEMAVHVRFLDG